MSTPRFIMDDRTRGRTVANLDRFERQPSRHFELTPAAVALVVVANDRNEACFIITRRASGMRDHPGQWALPGGRMDPGETPAQAGGGRAPGLLKP